MAPKTTDASFVMRNSFWACVVHKLQGKHLGWDKLDRCLLPRVGRTFPPAPYPDRPRVFYGFFSDGYDPSCYEFEGVRLIDELHKDPQFQDAKRSLDHSFWAIVGPAPLSIKELRAMRREAMLRLELLVPTLAERLVAVSMRVPGFGGTASTSQDISESMYNLVEGGKLDGLTVCAANYLLALDSGLLETAIIYRDVLGWAVDRVALRWGIPDPATVSLRRLVKARILQRRYSQLSGADIGFPLGKKKKTSVDASDLGEGLPPPAELTSGLPIVVSNATTLRFLNDYPERPHDFSACVSRAPRPQGQTQRAYERERVEALNVAFNELLCALEDDCDRQIDMLGLFSHFHPVYASLYTDLMLRDNRRTFRSKDPRKWRVAIGRRLERG